MAFPQSALRRILLSAGLMLLASGGMTAGLWAQATINESAITQTRRVNPAGGADFTTLAAAFSWLNANPTIPVKITIAPGTYREGGLTLNNRDTLTILEGDSPGTTIISGSDVWTGWTADGSGNWYRAWTNNWGLRPPLNQSTPGDLGLRAEMVFVNGILLRQVATLAEMADGTFHVDETIDRITIRPQFGLTPATATVEVSVRQNLLNINRGTSLVLRNLVFQHSSSGEQFSHPNPYTIFLGGEHNDANPNRDFARHVLFDRIVSRWNNSSGATIANTQYITVRNSSFSHNGQTGIGSNRTRYVYWDNNDFIGNNWRIGLLGGIYGDSPAGTKLLSHSDVTIENSRFMGNFTSGLWFDYANENMVVNRVTSLHNWGVGFYNEANYGPVTADYLLIRQNGNHPDSEIAEGGILWAEANAFTINNSYLIDNYYYGVGVRTRDRTSTAYWSRTPYDGRCRNLRVYNTLMVASRNMTKLYQSSAAKINGNAIANHVHAQQAYFISELLPTYLAANNRYYSPYTTTIFSSATDSGNLGYNEVNLATWQSSTGQDTGSVWDPNYQSRLDFDSFQESGGLVAFEAENYHTYDQRSDTARWLVGTGYQAAEHIGASGWGYMKTLNEGHADGSAASSAILTYKVRITTPGTYHLALRRLAPTAADDAAFILVNGVQVGDAGIVSGTATLWQWQRAATALGPLSAGVHTISIVRREDGFLIDRVVLADDPAKLPANGSVETGPESSPLGTPPVSGNPLTVIARNPSTDERAQQSIAFRISRQTGSGDLVVPFSFTGTATPGNDYTAPASPALIPNGATYVDVLVPVLDDDQLEREETITFNILPSEAYSLAAGSATTTILASDLIPVSSFAVTQLPDTTGQIPVTLRNPFPTPLVYSIGSGNPGLAYEVLKSGQTGGPAYVWNDIKSTGTVLTDLASQDDAVTTIPVGFAFPFFSSSYASVKVSINGFLSFTDSISAPTHTTLPNTAAPAALIAPLWRNLRTDSSSNIYYRNTDAQTLVIQWENLRYGNPNQRVTFQAVLKSDGRIFFYYKTTGGNSNYAVGLQDVTKTKGVQLAYNQNYVSSAGTAVALTRTPSWLNNSGPLQITVPALSSVTTTYTVNTSGYALGFTQTIPVEVAKDNVLAEQNTLSFALTVAQPQPPAAPANPAVTAVTTNSITLSWSDQASDETGFELERALAAEGPWSPVATLMANTTSHLDTGREPATTYHYRIRAVNAVGTSVWAGPVAATTISAAHVVYACDGFSPDDYPNVSVGLAGHAPALPGWAAEGWTAPNGNPQIRLNGLTYTEATRTLSDIPGRRPEVDNNQRVGRYLDTSATGPFASLRDTASGRIGKDGTTLYMSFLMRINLYGYNAFELQNGGTGDSQRVFQIGRVDGTSSTQFKVRRLDNATVRQSAELGLLNRSANFFVVKIEFGAGSTPGNERITVWRNPDLSGEAANTPTAVIENANHFVFDRISLATFPGGGTGGHTDFDEFRFGNTWVAITPHSTSAVTVPAAPSSLTAQPLSASSIHLQWTDNSTDETGFKVERSPDGSTGWALVATTQVNATSFTDTGLPASGTFHYRVRAANSAGNSAPAPAASATTWSALEEWRVLRSLPPDLTIPGPDGVAPLLHYALATEPGAGGLLPMKFEFLSLDNINENLALTFFRARHDIIYEVLASFDLKGWQVIATDPGEVGAEITVVDPVPVSGAPARFLRLRVTAPLHPAINLQ